MAFKKPSLWAIAGTLCTLAVLVAAHEPSAGECDHDHVHAPVDSLSTEVWDTWTSAILATTIVGLAPVVILLFLPRVDNNPRFLKVLLAFAVGGLLGDVFLHLIPHAMDPHDHHHDHDHHHNHHHDHDHDHEHHHDHEHAHHHDHHHHHDHDHDHEHDGHHEHEHHHDHEHEHDHDYNHHHEHDHDHEHEHDHHHKGEEAKCPFAKLAALGATNPHTHNHDHTHGHAHDEHEHSHAHSNTIGLWILAGIVSFLFVEKLVKGLHGGEGE